MMRTLQRMVQEQAVVIKRTFIEREEGDDQIECAQRFRCFSDSALVISSAPATDVDVLSDILSSGEDCVEGAEQHDGESNSDQGEHSEGDSPMSSWSDEDNEESQELPLCHWRTMSPFFAMHPDAASLAAVAQSPFLLLPEGESSSEQAEHSEGGSPLCRCSDQEEEDDAEEESHELPLCHWRTMSPCCAMHPDAASLAAVPSPFLPQPGGACPAHAEGAAAAHAGQPEAQAQAQAPQFFAILVPAAPGQCSYVAVAAPSTGPIAAAQPLVLAPSAVQSAPVATTSAASDSKPASTEEAVETRTTLMVRNVPNNYSREQFLALLNKMGLSGLYDFVYLPVDFQTGAGLGYGFVNAVDSYAATRVKRALDGFSSWVVPSRKRCSVAWNDPHQGLEANVGRYRNSPVMHPVVPDAYKPAIFSNGVRVPYPEPTKAIKAPKLKK